MRRPLGLQPRDSATPALAAFKLTPAHFRSPRSAPSCGPELCSGGRKATSSGRAGPPSERPFSIHFARYREQSFPKPRPLRLSADSGGTRSESSARPRSDGWRRNGPRPPRVWVTPAHQHPPPTQTTSPSCKLKARDLLRPWASFTPQVKRESSFFHFITNFFPSSERQRRATQPSDCAAETRARVPSGSRVPGLVTRGKLRVGRAELLGVALTHLQSSLGAARVQRAARGGRSVPPAGERQGLCRSAGWPVGFAGEAPCAARLAE